MTEATHSPSTSVPVSASVTGAAGTLVVGADESGELRCHMCRQPLPSNYVRAGGLLWCPDLIECTFRSRRRFGISVTRWLEFKAAELVAEAARTTERAAHIASLPPKVRDWEYLDHIKSPEWEVFSDHQKYMARHLCEKCRNLSVDLATHHMHYRTLKHETPQDVLVLCPICHRELDELRRQGHQPAVTVSVEVDMRGRPHRRVTWP